MVDDIEVEDFLAHHGIKGQRWGIRHPELAKFGRGTEVAAKAFGRGSLITAKATGRGIKKTAIFVHDHPRFSASVAAGAAFTGLLLRRKIHNNQINKEFNREMTRRLFSKKISNNITDSIINKKVNSNMKTSSEEFKKVMKQGLEWRIKNKSMAI